MSRCPVCSNPHPSARVAPHADRVRLVVCPYTMNVRYFIRDERKMWWNVGIAAFLRMIGVKT